MCCTVGRFAPLVLLYFLAVICVTVPLVFTLEAENQGWNSLGKDADVFDSLFSVLEKEKLHSLLKDIPPAELQKVTSRLVGQVKTDHSELEKRKSVLEAIKKEGLLDSWKKDLDSLIFDDNALPESDDKAKEFQSNLKCAEKSKDHSQHQHQVTLPEGASKQQIEEAVQEMLGNKDSYGTPPDSVKEGVDRNDVDYLFQVAEDTFDTPSETLQPPKLAPSPYKPERRPSYPSFQDRRKVEAKKKPSKKNDQEPLSAFVGMAKKLLGQDDNDPTLDLVANMASAYIKNNMDNSAETKKNDGNNGPDLSSLLQLASLFSGAGGGNSGSADNPLQSLTSLLSNSGMDMNQLLQMGSMFMGKSLEVAPSRRNKATSPMVELIIRTVANFLDMDSVHLLDYYNGISKLTEANSWNEVNVILRKTTGTDVETMLDLLANDDVRQQISEGATSTVVHWMQHFLDPESLNGRILFLNALSQQYNYPLIDPKNLIETLSQLLDRLSVDYFNTNINVRPYLRHTEKQLRGLLHIDPTERIDFRKFSGRELTIAVQHTMKTEIFDPLSQLWLDFRLASRFPKCARTILCRRNAPSATRSASGLKEGTTRAIR